MNGNPALQVDGLSYAYVPARFVLDNLRFQVAEGERIGLVGPNGAGKTTLFLCLAGVLNVPANVIRLAGLDPSQPAERRQLPTRVGIVFQNSDDQLFSSSVFDDVAFGPLNLGLAPDEVRLRVHEALERVGLAGFEKRVPYHLSGGEKRRTALAGVLAMRPDILLLDEPSMFLDPRGRRELLSLLQNLGGTQILASHDLDLILDCCTRVLVLDRGKVVGDGPTRQILADAVLMEKHGLEVPYRLKS